MILQFVIQCREAKTKQRLNHSGQLQPKRTQTTSDEQIHEAFLVLKQIHVADAKGGKACGAVSRVALLLIR